MASKHEATEGVKPKVLAVFAIRNAANGSIWVRAGRAVKNRDGSVNVDLDVLPIDGKLHIREVQ
jgi:hypothetical protein